MLMALPNRKPPAAGRGKKKGTLNRTTKTVREIFTLFVEHNAEGAQALYDRVAHRNPAAALSLLAKVAEFVLPKLHRAEVQIAPDTMSTLSGDPIRDAQSAAAAYLLVIGQPMADLSQLTFEPPAMGTAAHRHRAARRQPTSGAPAAYECGGRL
jgi:hypothetical protein